MSTVSWVLVIIAAWLALAMLLVRTRGGVGRTEIVSMDELLETCDAEPRHGAAPPDAPSSGGAVD